MSAVLDRSLLAPSAKPTWAASWTLWRERAPLALLLGLGLLLLLLSIALPVGSLLTLRAALLAWPILFNTRPAPMSVAHCSTACGCRA